MKTITPQELKKALDEGETVTLVDVRSAADFAEKHIPGSVNAPADGEMVQGLPDPESRVVVYAEHEGSETPQQVCERLEAAGYDNAMCLVGGLLGWMEAGGQVEGGQES
jgi:rhodanese-related sulfurtransferase